MRAPRRANVWSQVGSTLYPHLQNIFFMILFSIIFIYFICYYHMLFMYMLSSPVCLSHNCDTLIAYRMQLLFVAVFLGYNQYLPGGFMVLW